MILKSSHMKNLKKVSPVFFSVIIVIIFFWRVFLQKKVLIPGDFIVGVYYPWLDYKWGFPAGVPVKNPIMADVVSFSYPMRILATNLLKSGKLPLWNPYILTGTPLLANFQSASFSPTNILYFFLDKFTAWSLQIILQHLFALIFTYLLLRYWKASKTGSLLGGIVYAFSGFSLIWSQWNAHTLVASFIPLLILLTDKFLKEKKNILGVLISIILAFQIFSGYPQVVIYTFLAIGLLWLTRIQTIKEKIKTTILLGIFILLGIGLAGVQILPGKELLSLSQRTIEAHPFGWAFLPVTKIITFIAPDYFGNHATGNYWGPQDYTSNTGFVGIVALTLALLAITKIKKKMEILFPFILTILSLLLSFPTPLSIFFWKSGVFGFNAAAAHRALVLFCFGISVLCGFGFDALNFKVKFKYKVLILLLIYLLITIFAFYALKIHQPIGLKNLVLPISVLLISSLIFFKTKFKFVFVILSVIELFYFGWKFTPFSNKNLVFPTTPIINFLKNQPKPFRTTGDHVIPINFRMAYGIESVEGYDAVYPAGISNFIQKINGGGTFRRYAIVDNDISPLLDLVNTKYYLALKSDPNLKRFDTQRFKLVDEDKSVLVYESLSAKPRAFLVNQNIGATYLLYSENEEIMSISSSNNDKLFISETYYPGWKAYIDGKETKIERSDLGFRNINITKGKHIVKMTYEPNSFFDGLKISFGSLIILVILGLTWRRKIF